MAIKSTQFTFIRSGLRPAPYVVERLERFHPDVKLAWNYALDRWMLVERSLNPKHRGAFLPIMLVQGPKGEFKMPDISLVHYLNEIDVRCQSFWEREAWLRGLDEGDKEGRDKDQAEHTRALAEDMGDRMWHDAGKRTSVLIDHGSTPDSPPAGGASTA